MAYQRAAKDKDEPPGKQWSIQAQSPDGVTVTLGKYDTKTSAESDFHRIVDEGFYSKALIVEPPEGVERIPEPAPE